MTDASHRRSGGLAEDFAADYLAGLGHEIIGRNFAVCGGEIDIISADGEYIVFTEVKMRSKNESPASAVTHEKILRIRKCADIYMQSKAAAEYRSRKVRIDVVAVRRDETVQGGFSVVKHVKGFDAAPRTARRH